MLNGCKKSLSQQKIQSHGILAAINNLENNFDSLKTQYLTYESQLTSQLSTQSELLNNYDQTMITLQSIPLHNYLATRLLPTTTANPISQSTTTTTAATTTNVRGSAMDGGVSGLTGSDATGMGIGYLPSNTSGKETSFGLRRSVSIDRKEEAMVMMTTNMTTNMNNMNVKEVHSPSPIVSTVSSLDPTRDHSRSNSETTRPL